MESTKDTLSVGEEVVKATGELHATVQTAVETATTQAADHEEVKGWLTTIFKALLAAFKI